MDENPFKEAETTYELLGLLAGAASMCWEDILKAGVFKVEMAGELVDAAHDRLVELILRDGNNDS